MAPIDYITNLVKDPSGATEAQKVVIDSIRNAQARQLGAQQRLQALERERTNVSRQLNESTGELNALGEVLYALRPKDEDPKVLKVEVPPVPPDEIHQT